MEMNEENIRNSDDRITEIRTGKRRDNKLSIVCSISKLRIQPVRNRVRVEPSKGHTLGKHTTQVRTPQGHTLKRITTGFRNRKPDVGLYAINMLLKPWRRAGQILKLDQKKLGSISCAIVFYYPSLWKAGIY